MITQYYTSTRPDTTTPFYSESEEGKTRSDAIIQLMDSHPELVSSYLKPAIDPESLTAILTVNYHDVDSFRAFLDLVTEIDPTLRNDRAKYVKNNNQKLVIEYYIDGMEERGLIANITPDQSILHKRDGTVEVRPTVQNP